MPSSKPDSKPSSGDKRMSSVDHRRGPFKRKAVQTISAFVVVTVTAIAIPVFIAGWVGTYSFRNDIDHTRLLIESAITDYRFDTAVETANIRLEIKEINEALAQFTSIPDDNKLASRMAQLANSVSDVGSRLGRLEAAILEDPAKAIELPLLRNEVETVKSNHHIQLLALREEITRVYDFNKWFIVLMFTMVLGIVSLAVTNFVKT